MKPEIVEFEGFNFWPKDLIEFFVAKGIDSNCPACRTGTTAIQADDEGKVRFAFTEFVQFKDSVIYRVPDLLHPSVMAVCHNCGFVRYFSAHRVNLWMAGRQNKAEGK